MRKLFSFFLFATLALTANVASARNIWRECGIGGMLFKQTGWAAITSNIIWDLGTTATTSNVSSDDMCEGPTASTASFINETYANLEEELAVGEGKHVTAMLNLMGCSADSRANMVSGLRADLSAQMSGASYASNSKTQNAEALFNSVMSLATAAQCRAI